MELRSELHKDAEGNVLGFIIMNFFKEIKMK